MNDKDNVKESRTVKMQKLRRAVGRLRNLRSSQEVAPAASSRESWLSRLKSRLGLGGDASEDGA